MLFTWSEFLTDQVKIRDAYQMLKKQGKTNIRDSCIILYRLELKEYWF